MSMRDESDFTRKFSLTAPGTDEQQFEVRRIYLKNVSFYVTDGYDISSLEGTPHTSFDIRTSDAPLTEKLIEVVLTVTLTCKMDDRVDILIEVNQAGIFLTRGYSASELRYMVRSFGPCNILFPYAREVIDDLLSKSDITPIHLVPPNFDTLYEQYLLRQAVLGNGDTLN
ncbi:MAG: protein-export chaperone SecB [Gammaproteobacteria bacterium]|nr:protein-export chaperone SecB [Gammaproteobacteria bacterium]